MKMKNIIKKGFTAFLIVLSCFGVLSSVCSAETSEVTSSSSGSSNGVIRGSKEISTYDAVLFFCHMTGFTPFEAFQYYPDVFASKYGVRLSNPYNIYYFWKDDSNIIHYRYCSASDDTITNSCCDNAHVTTNLSDDTTSPGSITGADLKAIAADYNSRYVPMPVQDFYVWSYQSSTTGTRLSRNPIDFLKSFQFEPYVPLYSSTSTTWGGKGWNGGKDDGVYILPFYYDNDNSHGVFYHNYYAHIYVIPATSDTVASLCLDVYSLVDGSLLQSRSFNWNSNYTYLSFNFANYFNIYGYKSSFDYATHENSTRLLFSNTLLTFYSSDYTSQSFNTMIVSSSFSPDTDSEDDWGYYVQNKPFELFANQTQIEFSQIPDNYVITINGDTIYDYSITNPDTGDSTTINNYITNNYTIPSSDDPTNPTDPTDPSDPTSPSITGNVTVSGNVDVSGKIEIDTKPIDINVNVNGGGSSGTVEGVQFDQDVSLNNYYNWMNDQTTGFSAFMSQVFSWLPPPIISLLCAGFSCVIIARFLGR